MSSLTPSSLEGVKWWSFFQKKSPGIILIQGQSYSTNILDPSKPIDGKALEVSIHKVIKLSTRYLREAPQDSSKELSLKFKDWLNCSQLKQNSGCLSFFVRLRQILRNGFNGLGFKTNSKALQELQKKCLSLSNPSISNSLPAKTSESCFRSKYIVTIGEASSHEEAFQAYQEIQGNQESLRAFFASWTLVKDRAQFILNKIEIEKFKELIDLDLFCFEVQAKFIPKSAEEVLTSLPKEKQMVLTQSFIEKGKDPSRVVRFLPPECALIFFKYHRKNNEVLENLLQMPFDQSETWNAAFKAMLEEMSLEEFAQALELEKNFFHLSKSGGKLFLQAFYPFVKDTPKLIVWMKSFSDPCDLISQTFDGEELSVEAKTALAQYLSQDIPKLIQFLISLSKRTVHQQSIVDFTLAVLKKLELEKLQEVASNIPWISSSNLEYLGNLEAILKGLEENQAQAFFSGLLQYAKKGETKEKMQHWILTLCFLNEYFTNPDFFVFTYLQKSLYRLCVLEIKKLPFQEMWNYADSLPEKNGEKRSLALDNFANFCVIALFKEKDQELLGLVKKVIELPGSVVIKPTRDKPNLILSKNLTTEQKTKFENQMKVLPQWRDIEFSPIVDVFFLSR